MPTSILHVSSELYPQAKTGGLADVVAALPLAQRRIDLDARVLIPGYPRVLDEARGFTVELRHPDLFGAGPARVYSGTLGDGTLPVFVVDCPELFARTGGLYGTAEGDWPDNARRFGALGWVAAQIGQGAVSTFPCDVVHAHDWQGALALPYLSLSGAEARRIMTIHNIAYPGSFDLSVAHPLGLPEETLSVEGVEFYGRLSFLKAGLVYAEKITTVSPTYAEEIKTPEHGGGFDGLLRARGDDLVGVLNGVDYDQWSPEHDPHLPHGYGEASLRGKRIVKQALQAELGLGPRASNLLVGVVSRFAWQKGMDLVARIVPWLVEHNAQLAILGAGDADIAAELSAHATNFPGRVAVHVGYDEGLAHRIIGGSDVLLVPSRAEPCGLTQLYALRYGTPPVVRHTGGLADTVTDADTSPEGTGFVFEPPTAEGLRSALTRALSRFAEARRWSQLQRRGMRQDFGWDRAAGAMSALYAQIKR